MSKFKLKYLSILFVILTGLNSCVSDFFEFESIPAEGEASLSAEVVFRPVVSAPVGTRTDGDIIQQIESLCVILYDGEGNFIKRIPQSELVNYNVSNNEVTSPSDAVPEGTHQVETTTPKATFTIPGISYGKYQIYAVANMGNLDGYSDDDIATVDALQSIRLTWNDAKIEENNQMFGYFTLSDNMDSKGFTCPGISVNRQNMSIHAWLKRAASKVTVAVDGSGLKEGVTVWIKSIQIKDITKYCYLGKDNTAPTHYLIKDGEKTLFSDQQGVGTGEEVTKTRNWPLNMADAHAPGANAYFFYENMQGTGQLKHQSWDGGETIQYPNGNHPQDPGNKDSKIAGTYIEVIGYYKSTNPEREGEGTIIYRFMLGKDVDRNYDAQRNYHYKLTLKLKNFANENDWHIVYDPDPDILLPNPYYISYLYNEPMTYPFKVMGFQLVSLSASIPDNDVNKKSWAPYNCNESGVYWDGAVEDAGPWNGFLSLQRTTDATFGTVAEGFGSSTEATYSNNKTVWNQGERSHRNYEVTNGRHGSEATGFYEIQGNGAGEWEVKIPFYTRARVMTEQTGYTGNNPFIAYMREADVVITAVIKDSEGINHTISKTIQIRQSRRIVNPTGIWRDANDEEDFHIQLKILPSENATSFENLKSDGPWMAVIKNGDWFDIIPTEGVSQKNPDGTISGVGDTYDDNNPGKVIDFYFKPKSTTSTPRGGIIKIYYNNFSCIHLIYVRQGYDPVSFYGSNTYWHSYNMLTADSEVSDPAAEGSYFRQYNLGLPISASNNTVAKFDVNGAPPVTFAIEGKSESLLWEDIKKPADVNEWGTFTVRSKGCRLPIRSDWDNLIGNAVLSRPNTIYGYGVLYTSGSRATAELVSDVYGAREGATKGKGMRGTFICDSISGTQIFLPIAASGYGRFKQWSDGSDYRQRYGWMGVIQYSNRYTYFPSVPTGWLKYTVQYKPLFYDVFKSQGCMYWIGGQYQSTGAGDHFRGGYALDINYYTLNLRYSDLEDLGIYWPSSPDPSGTDAILMRLVEDR